MYKHGSGSINTSKLRNASSNLDPKSEDQERMEYSQVDSQVDDVESEGTKI